MEARNWIVPKLPSRGLNYSPCRSKLCSVGRSVTWHGITELVDACLSRGNTYVLRYFRLTTHYISPGSAAYSPLLYKICERMLIWFSLFQVKARSILSNRKTKLQIQKQMDSLCLGQERSVSSSVNTRIRLYGKATYHSKFHIFVGVDADIIAERSISSNLHPPSPATQALQAIPISLQP